MEISVMSGKGGTGKTTVSVNLALSAGEKIRFLDCDVEEPDAKIFLLPRMERIEYSSVSIPVINERRCTYCGKCAEFCIFNALAVVKKKILFFERLCRSCGGCRLICPEGAITEGKRENGFIRCGEVGQISFIEGELKAGEETGYSIVRTMRKMPCRKDLITIIDCPPGLSPTLLEAIDRTDFSIVVTEPSEIAFHDMRLSLELLERLKIPCGVIINKFSGKESFIEDYCSKKGIDILLTIPFDMGIAGLYSKGIPFSREIPLWRNKFREILKKIVKVW